MIFHVLSPTEIYQIPLISCRFLTTLSCKIIRIKGGGGLVSYLFDSQFFTDSLGGNLYH